MLFRASLIAIVALLAGCATVYQKEGFFTNGFSEKRVEESIFTVTFRANEHTPADTVVQYALKRASDTALKHGYRYFVIIDKKNLHYPSVRLTIQCFKEKPDDPNVIDAQNALF
jgi:hypothetical protein